MAILTTALRRAGIPEREAAHLVLLRRRPPGHEVLVEVGERPPLRSLAPGGSGVPPEAMGRGRAHRLMPTVKVLYADVDGTMVGPLGNLLWDSHRTPTLAAAEALVRAAREGLEVVALTGRARAGMFEFARVLGLQSWICELGGIRVYDRGETVVHEHGAFPGGGVPTDELHRAVDAPPRDATPAGWRSTAPGTPPGSRRSSSGASVDRRGRGTPGGGRVRLGHAGRQRGDPPPLRDPAPRWSGSAPTTSSPGACRRWPPSPPTGPTGAWTGRSAPWSATPPPTSTCRGEVGRCFLVRNGLDKDPSLAWVARARLGRGGHRRPATATASPRSVHRLLDGRLRPKGQTRPQGSSG